MKKFMALFLAVSMMMGVSGCTSSALRTYTAPPTPSEVVFKDYTYAYTAYSPDDLVMHINGNPVFWDEYFYWALNSVKFVEDNFGDITNFDAVFPLDESMSIREYVEGELISALSLYKILEGKAAEFGVTLDSEDLETVEQFWQQDILDIAGGSEEYLLMIFEKTFLTRELYDYINGTSLLYIKCFEEIFGEYGEKCPDEDAMIFAEEEGYMHIKQILFSLVDEDGAPLSGDAADRKRALANEVLQKLKDSSDVEAAFDQLMNEYSEDPSLPYYPDGYCFSADDINETLVKETAKLDIGEFSGVIKADYGVLIILRESPEPDSIVEYVSEEEQYTLRYVAAISRYQTLFTSWIDEAEVVYTPEFEDLDLAAIFVRETGAQSG